MPELGSKHFWRLLEYQKKKKRKTFRSVRAKKLVSVKMKAIARKMGAKTKEKNQD